MWIGCNFKRKGAMVKEEVRVYFRIRGRQFNGNFRTLSLSLAIQSYEISEELNHQINKHINTQTNKQASKQTRKQTNKRTRKQINKHE